MRIDVTLNDAEFLAGVVVARGVTVGPSPDELARRLDEAVARGGTEATKEPIRAMLRRGGFKPSGRNKPASEYLAAAAREGRFPRINNLVDAINLMSLESGLPISLLDLAAVGERGEIRYGRDAERYVFNATGQEIELAGLQCVCGPTSPVGSPVKDSMAGKIKDATTDVIGVVYGLRAEAARIGELVPGRFADLFTRYAGATSVEGRVFGAGQSADL
jgi:DNA/RNA-binding domain of Phe-tRNA-synthetase-like protein